MRNLSGIEQCEAALERLLNETPYNKDFVGEEQTDITPAMVSVEAGYDKGYLKRSRQAHMPLIAQIDRLRAPKKASKSSAQRLSKALSAADKAKANEAALKDTLDKVLAQNLMLVERVRELEKALHMYGE